MMIEKEIGQEPVKEVGSQHTQGRVGNQENIARVVKVESKAILLCQGSHPSHRYLRRGQNQRQNVD